MSQYSDCIIYSENMEYPANRPIPWVAKLDDLPVFRCSYSIHWNMPFDEPPAPPPPRRAPTGKSP